MSESIPPEYTELLDQLTRQTKNLEKFDTMEYDVKNKGLDEGLQFAPKLGFIYKPNEKSSFRN